MGGAVAPLKIQTNTKFKENSPHPPPPNPAKNLKFTTLFLDFESFFLKFYVLFFFSYVIFTPLAQIPGSCMPPIEYIWESKSTHLILMHIIHQLCLAYHQTFMQEYHYKLHLNRKGTFYSKLDIKLYEKDGNEGQIHLKLVRSRRNHGQVLHPTISGRNLDSLHGYRKISNLSNKGQFAEPLSFLLTTCSNLIK